jgi:hypothetical protein
MWRGRRRFFPSSFPHFLSSFIEDVERPGKGKGAAVLVASLWKSLSSRDDQQQPLFTEKRE